MIKSQFRIQILLITVLPVIISAIILAYVLISGQVEEFDKRTNEKGRNLANYIAIMSEYGIFSDNFDYLDPVLSHTVNKQDVIAVIIKDRNESHVLNKINPEYIDIEMSDLSSDIYIVYSADILKTTVEINDLFTDVAPVYTSNILGSVDVVLSRKNTVMIRQEIIFHGMLTTGFFVMLTIFVSLLFSRSITKPIEWICSGVKEIKKGNFNFRIKGKFPGEIQSLATGINQMTSSLEQSRLKDEEQKKELILAKKDAEQANRAKSLFLSSMSHEMRTPMNAILGYAQLIELDAKDKQLKANTQELLTAGRHLMKLIEELLEISHIESGEVKLCLEECSIKSVLEFCLSVIKPSADEKSIVISNLADQNNDVSVFADEVRLRQIILNLLSNAVKYNNYKGSVEINYSVNSDVLCFSVIDNGFGIEEEYFDNLFSYFDRAGQECSTIAGTGLGLAISKTLIEKMNGEIGFNTQVGEGSHFWIKIPVHKLSKI